MDVPPPLLVGPELEEGGAEHVQPDHGDELGRPGCRKLLVDDELLGRGRPPPPNAAGQARPTS